MLALLVLFSSCKLKTSQPESNLSQDQDLADQLLTLENFNYKMVVENEPIQDKKQPLIIVMHSMGSSPEEYKDVVGNFDFPC